MTIGRGTQNYTCARKDDSPPISGAVVNLFDITLVWWLYRQGVSEVQTGSSLQCVSNPGFGHGVCKAATSIARHYFQNGKPVFEFWQSKEIFIGTRIAMATAPADADPGPHKTGAIDWLALDIAGSINIIRAYRISTAGGKPPPGNCSILPIGTTMVPYAAQYIFFEVASPQKRTRASTSSQVLE